ncbi:MAG: hypothetical protein NW205_07430 [Hyphomicrobiaceae bacterium]|nr:hypothetical protein [Hyphomicrobiaceae bacterium]
MSFSARAFVAIVFTVLGLSFVATTATLVYEFGIVEPKGEWFALAAFYSHLFVFFPIFGLLALCAFYIPSCAFTDMYWRHVPYGQTRFAIGFAVLAGASLAMGWQLGGGSLRSIWEAKPGVLVADQGEPAGCLANQQQSCRRVPVLAAVADVREKSSARTGMTQFVRDCQQDPLIETPPEALAKRYCFVTRTRIDAALCCDAQLAFATTMQKMTAEPADRSMTGFVHKLTLPFKIFFLLVVMVIALLLAARRHGIAEHYRPWIRKIERGVLVGAFAMLFLPIMNLAFLQSSGLLYGTAVDSNYRFMSWPLMIGFGCWALALLFFFFRDSDKDVETVGRVAGVVGSALAISNYGVIIDLFARYAGAGGATWSFAMLAVIAAAAGLAILIQPKKKVAES